MKKAVLGCAVVALMAFGGCTLQVGSEEVGAVDAELEAQLLVCPDGTSLVGTTDGKCNYKRAGTDPSHSHFVEAGTRCVEGRIECSFECWAVYTAGTFSAQCTQGDAYSECPSIDNTLGTRRQRSTDLTCNGSETPAQLLATCKTNFARPDGTIGPGGKEDKMCAEWLLGQPDQSLDRGGVCCAPLEPVSSDVALIDASNSPAP